ncbi:MAG: class I SAM-dependent methyltransferase [Thermodesulfobacteriota bacterium]
MRALAVKERAHEHRRLAHSGAVIDEKESLKVLDCSTCGFVHIDPIPHDRDMEKMYMEEYFCEEKQASFEYAREDLEWWNIAFDERLGFMESRLGPGQRRILDIGCGPGFFLERAAGRGWQCLGVEPSRTAAKYARGLGLEVKKGFFDGPAFKEEGHAFEAVHISEVLEHVADPLSVLRESHDILEDNGIICAVVTNDYNPVQKVLRDSLGYSQYWISVPQRKNYFSIDSIKALMRKAGFTIANVSASFPMDFFLLMGENYVGDEKLVRSCHRKRKNLDTMLSTPLLKGFKEEMSTLLARHNMGGEVVVYGIKGESWPEPL